MTRRYKYPSTPHMPFSPGVSRNDSVLTSLDHFQGEEVILSVKQDGENTSLYTDARHARSRDGRHHESQDWLAAFHAGFAHDIPLGWRICGENMFAEHSIRYDSLPSYFFGFSIWDESNTALSWDETLEYFGILGILPVPVLYRGPFDEKVVRSFITKLDVAKDEGVVMRKAGRISYAEFNTSYAKWVRKGHVQTSKHWKHRLVIPNGLANSE